MKKLLFLYLAVCSLAFSQAVRLDPTPVMTTATNVPPGAMAPVLAVPGSTVHVCEYPANSASGSPCTNYATTYTDPTEGTACPSNAQLVLAGTTTCVSTADAQGNYGFWVDPGPIYTYTVTIPQGTTFGPYDFTPIVTGSSGAIIYNEGSTGAVNRTVTNRLQDYVSAKDLGAKGDGVTDDTAAIQASLNAVCLTGGKLFIPSGIYPVSSTIVTPKQCNGITFEGSGKYIETANPSRGTVFLWTGASGGTVLHVYASSWGTYSEFAIDGNALAGQGLWMEASNYTPADGSCQKNNVHDISIARVTGSPGRGLAVYGLHDDDDSQNNFHDMLFQANNVNVYQDGLQTVGNFYRNITSFFDNTYGFEFVNGDALIENCLFLTDPSAAPGTLTSLAHVYIGPAVHKAQFLNNMYECLDGLKVATFHNYSFPAGAAPNRNFPTYIKGDRIEWTMVGGKPLDYEQAGPITFEDVVSDDVNGSAEPKQFYLNDSVVSSIQATVIGGYYAAPSTMFSLGSNVSLRIANPAVQVFDRVIDGNDASYTSGSPTLTVTSAPFTSGMVGQYCYVFGMRAAFLQQQQITAFISSSQVTLAGNATATASSQYYRCGRNINQGAGQLITSTPSSLDSSTTVIDGGNPRLWMRQLNSDGSTLNWVMAASPSGASWSIMNGGIPGTSTPSNFFSFNQSGLAANSVVTVPLHIGSSTHQQVGIYYQDFAGINVGTIAAGTSFSTTVTLTGDTVTAGADGCDVWGGISTAGIVAQCSILSGNQALITYANVTASSILVGTTPIRVRVTKFSYTGP